VERSQTRTSTPRLSEVARHIVIPSGIVTTAWPRVVAQCADMGVSFDLWQHGIGSIALGKRADGKYAATVGGVVLSIPRQVGKTFLVGMIVIALCILHPGLTVLWSAHRTRTATKTFGSLKGMTSRKKIKPFMLEPRNSNGEQEIRFRNGSVIMFGAREQGFGRGFDEVDIEVFDEGQILSEKALEDMVPAANQSRQPSGALLFFMGTPPRPNDPGEEFTNRRAKALSGKAPNIFYVEFSADEDADPDDRKQWAKANPSFPQRTPVESMERMRENLTDEDSFRREALGLWDPVVEGGSVFPAAEWLAALESSLGLTLEVPVSKVSVGLAMSPDREWVSVVWCWSVGGRAAVDVVRKSGTDWVLPYLVERSDRIESVAVDQAGPAGTMLVALGGAGVPVRVVDTAAYKAACAGLVDEVRYGRFVHRGEPALDVAARRVLWRKVGDGQVFARRDSGVPIDPLEAAALAVWGLSPDPKRKEFFVQNLNELA
jgi:phage terminase large subunit-like protein